MATIKGSVGEEAVETGNIKTDTFMGETRGVTRTLGRQHGLDVVFVGTQAGTDGTTIVMPSLPQGTEMTGAQARAMRGFADHESAHIRHTDMMLWKDTFGGEDRVPPMLLAFTNAFEDLRIEKLAIADYPGVQKNLAATVALMAKHTKRTFDAITDPAERAKTLEDPQQVGPLAVTMAGRSVQQTNKDVCEDMLSMFGADVNDKARRWAAKVDGCKSTKDCMDLAVEVLKEMGLVEPKSSGGGSGGSGSSGGGDGKGGGEGEGAGEGEGFSKGGRGGNGAEDRPENSKHNTGIEAGDFKTVTDAPVSAELGKAVSGEANEMVKTKRNGVYRVFSTADDKFHTRHDPPGLYGSYTYGHAYLANSDGLRAYEASEKATRGEVSVMKRKLERMVLSKNRRDWNDGKEAGLLDPRRLKDAALGIPNVFRVRAERAEMDTSVCILIDLSGSMSGPKAALAQQVSIAMAQAFDMIGVDYGVFGFNNTSGAASGRGYARAYKDDPTIGKTGYGRTECMDIYQFKAFDEKLRLARGSMGAIESCVGGNNSDGDAVSEIWTRFKVRNFKRKILLVLSDGMPANHATCGNIEGVRPQDWRIRRAISQVTDEGCECVGIGIMSDAVSKFYPKYVVARSLSEFAGASMDMLAKVLVGERSRVSTQKAAA